MDGLEWTNPMKIDDLEVAFCLETPKFQIGDAFLFDICLEPGKWHLASLRARWVVQNDPHLLKEWLFDNVDSRMDLLTASTLVFVVFLRVSYKMINWSFYIFCVHVLLDVLMAHHLIHWNVISTQYSVE